MIFYFELPILSFSAFNQSYLESIVEIKRKRSHEFERENRGVYGRVRAEEMKVVNDIIIIKKLSIL